MRALRLSATIDLYRFLYHCGCNSFKPTSSVLGSTRWDLHSKMWRYSRFAFNLRWLRKCCLKSGPNEWGFTSKKLENLIEHHSDLKSELYTWQLQIKYHLNGQRRCLNIIHNTTQSANNIYNGKYRRIKEKLGVCFRTFHCKRLIWTFI